MNKPIILAVAGAVLGAVAAFAGFTLLMGGDSADAAPPPRQVVTVPGKLGPHITLADRVFNLVTEPGQSPVYLKLQTVVEFQTTDPRWERVLTGCGKSSHAAHLDGVSAADASGALMVSAAPGGVAPSRGVEAGGAAGDACEAELAALMASFEREIGSGRALMEDVVTSIVTGHTATEISTPAGKDALKAEIAEAVDSLMGEPPVTRVLFLNFITQ